MEMFLAGAMAATPAHAWAADPAFSTSSGVLALRTVLSLAFVLGLLFLSLRFLRGLQLGESRATTRAHPIASRARLDLGARREIRIVDVHGRLLVVGITDQSMQLLTELAPDALAEPAETASAACETTPAARLAARIPTPPGIARFLQRVITSF